MYQDHNNFQPRYLLTTSKILLKHLKQQQTQKCQDCLFYENKTLAQGEVPDNDSDNEQAKLHVCGTFS